jgi:hypothetical protein
VARKPPSPQRLLPGLQAPPKSRDDGPVTLPMREISAGTDAAWHLAPLGVSSGAAAFAPRSLVSQGVGPAASQFTMPKWVAVERGWLR